MIYVQLAPLDTTTPVYFAVKYNGVTQLKQNYNLSIFNLLNIILAINSNTYLGVYTFSKMMTVLFWHDEFKNKKNMLHKSSSIII